MIETDLRPLDEDLFPPVVGGGGGDSWSNDDAGDGWGWSEDPDEDDGSPYRRSRVMRVVAAATAAAVVLGSIGTWVVFLAVGSPRASFSVTSVETALPSTDPAGQVLVLFEVANASNTSAPAVCRATLATTTSTVGTATVRVRRLPGGGWARVTLRVPVDAGALSGHGPAAAHVHCWAAAA